MEPNRSLSLSEAVFQQAGLRHRWQGAQCEDITHISRAGEAYFCGLADGQSGRPCCAIGARESLRAAADYLASQGVAELAGYRPVYPLRFALAGVLRGRLGVLARDYREEEGAFASTLLLLGVDTRSGAYVLVHLGDGCVLGVRADGALAMVSPPENGVTDQYTWLTTSPRLLEHLRIYYGNVRNYRRLILLSDGAKALCRGKQITPLGQDLLARAGAREIFRAMERREPPEDASCLLLEISGG